MTEVAFYHLTKSNLEQTLAQLLQKTIDGGKRAVVMLPATERVEVLAQHLWTNDPGSWLAHGTEKDGNAEDQPIWITKKDENPNGASFLFLSDGASSPSVNEYERCFEIFDGGDEIAVSSAREKWKSYKDSGFELTYWHQNENGGWEKKDI
ncbi:MAG: DNA polymerase III subunit chi [Rhodospirillaceae bacterium]|nr:DNA polymerase III subunit chi [Rhodospirillaceae bacterium]